MRRIVFLISALATTPAMAQYQQYGYPAPHPQYQQQYFQQQPYYQQPAQTYYQQPVYGQPYQQAQGGATYEDRYRDQYYPAQGQYEVQHPIAQSQVNPAHGLVNTDYLNLGLGMTQVVDTNNATLFNVEYRYLDIYHGLRPVLGFHVDTDSAMYGYFGFNWDLYLTDKIIFTPTASMGAYTQGDGHDLGHGLEFRTGIELAYEMESKSRVGLQLTHLSNAGIGNRNPGTEILQVNYAFPLGWAE